MSKDQSSASIPPAWDPSPPPYSEHEGHSIPPVQAPQYEPPEYHSSTSDSTPLQAATSKFPPTMNGYFQWKHLEEFHLGPTASEKLYCVTIKVEHRKQTMTLHDGLTDKDAPLASLESDAWLRTRPVTITLSPQAADAIVEPFEGVVPYKRMAPSFPIPVGGDNSSVACERFEWRSSHGKEIKEIGGHSSGWKLVRLSQTAGEASDSRSHRAMGCSSDGKEIVAVIAHNASLSLSKGFRFAFLGSGLTGILGEKWEIMTVISAVHLWLLDFQTITQMVPAA